MPIVLRGQLYDIYLASWLSRHGNSTQAIGLFGHTDQESQQNSLIIQDVLIAESNRKHTYMHLSISSS